MKVSPGFNDQLMAMAAHRYCLGRASYIVGSCLEWLRNTWADFSGDTRRVMVRDTAEAIMGGNAGHDMDVRGWRDFLAWAFADLSDADKAWVRQAVAHKNKPWPLDKESADV